MALNLIEAERAEMDAIAGPYGNQLNKALKESGGPWILEASLFSLISRIFR